MWKQYSSSHFQPAEGPSRGLLCDCTLYNLKLREGSFEALIEIPGADEDTGDYESNDHQNPGPNADTNNGLGWKYLKISLEIFLAWSCSKLTTKMQHV